MKIHLSDSPIGTWKGDCAVVFSWASSNGEQSYTLPQDLAQLDQQAWGGALTEVVQEQDFAGKPNTAVATRLGTDIRKIVLVGLGGAEQITVEAMRRSLAVGLRYANNFKAKHVAAVIPALTLDLNGVIQALTEAALLVSHQDRRFKSAAKLAESNTEFAIETLTLLLPTSPAADSEAALARGQAVAAGTILARELVSAPANVVTPIALAETGRRLAQDHGFTVAVLGQEDCEQLGMGAFLGVAKASDLPPQFIHLTYRPSSAPVAKVALVGKGLTFDSGGLNIKTDSRSIAMMKTDMGGAAAVLGAARAIGEIKPQVEVHIIVAATENMISGRALHPGDILTASNQKTIEINNTDAEGRLTLADALVYAEKLGVDAIVDLATLTGACVVALGDDIAGLFTPDETLAQQLTAASQRAGEKIWQLPMEDSYFEGLNSGVADMKNTGPRPGGSITAALFLKQFVDRTPWAHLDVAGPVWTDKDFAYFNKGATGYGVRTLVQWVLDRETDKA